jgi:3,4-dihydroxy-2-butanone 4-phosphate synthase
MTVLGQACQDTYTAVTDRKREGTIDDFISQERMSRSLAMPPHIVDDLKDTTSEAGG